MTLNSANNLGVKETATITWTSIFRHPHHSPLFSTPSSKNSFRLSSHFIRLNGHLHGNVEFSLWSNKNDLIAQCRLSILDANDRKQFSREYDCDFRNKRFFCAEKLEYILQTMCEPLLVNDTWKIHCEVNVLNETPRKRKAPEAELEGSFTKPDYDFRALLESGKSSDFVIVVGGKKLQVHKNILAMRSMVLAKMFDRKDTKEVKEGQLLIKGDMSVEACELMILYIYSGEIEPTKLDEHAIELFVAADKYQLDHLKSICERSLIASFSIESVCSVVLFADTHKAVQLKSKCIQFMIDNYAKVMDTDGWKKLLDTNRMDLMADLFRICASQVKS